MRGGRWMEGSAAGSRQLEISRWGFFSGFKEGKVDFTDQVCWLTPLGIM